MSHNCQAIVFRCMDFRIDPTVFTRLLANHGVCGGQFDLVSVAGAAKSFLEADNGFLTNQIEISRCLHGIKKVVLVMHDNCGAYDILDPEEEDRTQSDDLIAVTRLLRVKFPDLAVETYILKGTAKGDFSLLKV